MKDFKFQSVEVSEQKRRLNIIDDIGKEIGDIFKPKEDEKVATAGLDIPDHKDWYKEGKVTQPYDQEGCGGCWAFSTAAAVESLAFISGYDKELTEYSVQQLIDCDTDNYACGGGWMYEGFAYVSEHGILKKEDYSRWSHSHHVCRVKDQELKQKNHIKDIGYVENDGRYNEELRELLQKQPISIAIYSTGRLMHYRDGILTEKYLKCSKSDNEVNHGVLLVGYGSTDDSSHESDKARGSKCKNYWIVRNSWGANWGHDGFFKLCADGLGDSSTPLGTCLINKYATWPTMDKKDINPDDVDWED